MVCREKITFAKRAITSLLVAGLCALSGCGAQNKQAASSNDEALAISKKVHGYPRAGETGDHLVVLPGIDTIDVSAIDTSLIGHSYYGSNGTVLADLLDLLQGSKPPPQRRWLRPSQLGTLLYWVFVADQSPVRAASPAEGSPRPY